jgi:outer membrane protein
MRFTFASLLLAGTLLTAPAQADTLPEAIASAYAANPEIAAARAQLRQIDEGVPLAKAGTRPSVAATGSFLQELSERLGDSGRRTNGGISLNQAIWEGGRIRANISAAEARILAARARVRALEYSVIVDTVTAYADVLRTAEIVKLNDNQVRVLEQQLRASKDRFEVGDVTRTDVAQSEARLAAARSNLIAAKGNSIVAEQAYLRLVGRPAIALQPLPPLPPIPASPEAARETAFASNPGLQAARLEEKAAADDVRAAKAERLPSVGASAVAQYTHFSGADLGGLSGFNPQIGVNASIPIFTGGAIASNIRRAQARQSELLEDISQSERVVSENATDNWALVQTAEAVIESSRVQVSANQLAAEGVRQENQVGSRDILDVLNAEQELLNARVTLVQAEREKYVAAYRLYATLGDLEPVLVGAPVGRYDPDTNTRRVAKSWDEFGADPDPRTDRSKNTAPLVGPQ